MSNFIKKGLVFCLSFAVFFTGFAGSIISANEVESLPVNNTIEVQSTENEKDTLEETPEEGISNTEATEEVVEETSPVLSTRMQTRGIIPVNTIADLVAAITSAANGDVISLSPTFVYNIGNVETATAAITIPSGDTRDLTIDGGNAAISRGSQFSDKLFTVQNDGTGKLTFQNMSLDGFVQSPFDLSGSGHVILDNVNISNTTTQAAIINRTSGIVTINNGTFVENKARAIDDAAGASNHEMNIDNSYFYGNTVPNSGAAIMLNSNLEMNISNSTFEKNVSASGLGGAICSPAGATNVYFTIESSYFLENSTTGNVGGAIAVFKLKSGYAKINNSIFEGNKSIGNTNVCDAGAVAIKNNESGANGSMEITNSTFIGNVAGDNGGALLLEATNTGTSYANIYNNTFIGNKAISKASFDSGGTTASGGAVQIYGAPSAVLSHNTFYQNVTENGIRGGALGISASSGTSGAVVANNIFIDNRAPGALAVEQNVGTKVGITANMNNNGNVGYDNGDVFIPGSPRNDLVIPENIFTEFDIAGNAVPITFGSIGSAGHTQVHKAYIPSPRIDEMLRTNDPRTTTGVLEDVRGYPREALTVSNPYYPNAGAVEIYWTKFDPGTGSWSSRFNVTTEGGIESLAYPGQFYKISNPPTFTSDPIPLPIFDENLTFTRNTLLGPTGQGFNGWFDAAKNEVKDVNEIYTSRKQTYVAQWRAGVFHLDFDLQGGTAKTGHGNDFDSQVILDGGTNLGTEPSSIPERAGYVFTGWYTDDLVGVLWNFSSDTIHADTTLYARWSPLAIYTLDFDMQGHGTQVASQSIQVGEIGVEPPNPNEIGYIFKGWTLDLTTKTLYDFSTPITQNTTLYAIWEMEGSNTNGGGTKPGTSVNKIPKTGGYSGLAFILLASGICLSTPYFLKKKRK